MGSSRHGQSLVAALAAFGLAGCGTAVAIIPKGTPTPKPQVTQIAPGVQVPVSALQLPAYTISVSHPLPTGVSAQKVVADVQVDNVIENTAIERQDPALLTYADTGDWLTAEQAEISQNETNKVKVLSIVDKVVSVTVGSEVDPQNLSASVAVILAGTERRITLAPTVGRKVTTKSFNALLWLLWNQAAGRYQVCDTAAS
ncbi:MAG TPA: hypothetical protein VNF75_08870 [Candidatus Dormibacteraeota bacterium]|nr:hypothetical protein [Candidatus Dormibacteraeota bacterium]